MNIVDILILAVLAFSLLAGMHKGFITSLLSTFGFVGSWFGARLVYERIANLALSNTTLMAVLNQEDIRQKSDKKERCLCKRSSHWPQFFWPFLSSQRFRHRLSPLKLMKKLPQCIPISGVLTIMILHIFRLMMKLI